MNVDLQGSFKAYVTSEAGSWMYPLMIVMMSVSFSSYSRVSFVHALEIILQILFCKVERDIHSGMSEIAWAGRWIMLDICGLIVYNWFFITLLDFLMKMSRKGSCIPSWTECLDEFHVQVFEIL